MENSLVQELSPTMDVFDVKDCASSANFQKYFCELFEKNGVLSDLRAYLRGHIVNVLKHTYTGDPPACQKNFMQRLELIFQALNILIVEYLICMDFNYTLSVFLSEIPLANMVFEFAKSLLKNSTEEARGLRFTDQDIWSILNYLGIKCDSEHASNIIEMYKMKEQTPLVLCILKCLPMYQENYTTYFEQNNTSDVCLSRSSNNDIHSESSSKSFDRSQRNHCKHYTFCQSCQMRIQKIRKKHKKKKEAFIKMFEQLKTVYETEIEMIKREEEKKIKRSLANHSLFLKKRYEEMEESFKLREAQLEQNVQQKKKFLWGLARTLREQHSHMSIAMRNVQRETELTEKENSLKIQIQEAETTLRNRGEEMRAQISEELLILQGHLESMKIERESIERERTELEKLKKICDTNTEDMEKRDVRERDEVHSYYDMLKDELTLLKKYLASSKLDPKCMTERGVMTETISIPRTTLVMNNEQELERQHQKHEDCMKTPNQVVNDLKKQKNVNFSQANLDELYKERVRACNSVRSGSSGRSDVTVDSCGHDCDRDTIQRLREENERLKTFTEQQRSHIDELSCERAQLRAQLTAVQMPTLRPRTAPSAMPSTSYYSAQGVNPSVSGNAVGWRKGAGEELTLFAEAHPRILAPGDIVPFIGVLRDRHADSRQHMINQWRTLRRRFSPFRCDGKVGTRRKEQVACSPPAETCDNAEKNNVSSSPLPQNHGNIDFERSTSCNEERGKLEERPKTTVAANKCREKSPNSVLREAKEKLKNKSNIKQHQAVTREKSPNSTLREARLRLRKLEIEAEAVEKSYRNFRKRQAEQRKVDHSQPIDIPFVSNALNRDLNISHSKPSQKFQESHKFEDGNSFKVTQEFMKKDFDKYFREYQTKYTVLESRFKNKNTTAEILKPIPNTYSTVTQNMDVTKGVTNINYIETPLKEFRKLYQNPKPVQRNFAMKNTSPNDFFPHNYRHKDINSDNINPCHSEKAQISLDDNIDKEADTVDVCNLSTTDEIKNKPNDIMNHVQIENINPHNIDNRSSDRDQRALDTTYINHNLLKIEIEKGISNNVQIVDSKMCENLVIEVESSIDSRKVVNAEVSKDELKPPMTIIVSPKRNTLSTLNVITKPRSPDKFIRSLTPELTEKPKTIEDTSKSSGRSKRSTSPEQAAGLTRNDVLDAIFNADATIKDTSSADLDDSKGDFERNINVSNNYEEEFANDFYDDDDNSNSELDITPISLPKTTEDDNFWDD